MITVAGARITLPRITPCSLPQLVPSLGNCKQLGAPWAALPIFIWSLLVVPPAWQVQVSQNLYMVAQCSKVQNPERDPGGSYHVYSMSILT